MTGLGVALWMQRYDLVAAGIAFGVPSTLLFFDLLPGGRNRLADLLRRVLR